MLILWLVFEVLLQVFAKLRYKNLALVLVISSNAIQQNQIKRRIIQKHAKIEQKLVTYIWSNKGRTVSISQKLIVAPENM